MTIDKIQQPRYCQECLVCERARKQLKKAKREMEEKLSTYTIMERLYCSTCRATENLTLVLKQTNDNLGIMYKYYRCNPCNNGRRKRYYDKSEDKSVFLGANNRYMNKKYNERYEREIVEFGKPKDWKTMSNHRKAKYLYDQRAKLAKA